MSTWTDIRDSTVKTLAAVAPALATALGGPMAGSAVAVLSKTLLGKDSATHEEVDNAIVAATPEQLLALKQASYDYEAKMKQIGVDLKKIAAADRASARDANKGSSAPQILTTIIIVAFGAEAWAVLAGQAAGLHDTTVAAIGGGVVTQTLHYVHQCLDYWLGSDDEP